MVLILPCISRSPSSSPYEVSSTCPPKSDPLPVRSSERYSPCNGRVSPPLSSSTDSLCSVMSNCSSRSSAEREAERMEKKQLLDLSLGKLRSPNNLPLRKHLLVFNTIKQLQRDLDLLDDEDLYSSLVGDSMEVDERRWLAPVAQAPLVAEPAPPSVEERTAPVSMEVDSETNACGDLWSWSANNNNASDSGVGFFDNIQDGLYSSPSFSSPVCTGGWGWCGWGSNDPWAPMCGELADPLISGGPLSPFELQHLFPSQLLLQA